jgi:hypothetical protein
MLPAGSLVVLHRIPISSTPRFGLLVGLVRPVRFAVVLIGCVVVIALHRCSHISAKPDTFRHFG